MHVGISKVPPLFTLEQNGLIRVAIIHCEFRRVRGLVSNFDKNININYKPIGRNAFFRPTRNTTVFVSFLCFVYAILKYTPARFGC